MTEDVPSAGDADAQLRAALAARVHGCWDRLEDAVSELVDLHGVTAEEITERVNIVAKRG